MTYLNIDRTKQEDLATNTKKKKKTKKSEWPKEYDKSFQVTLCSSSPTLLQIFEQLLLPRPSPSAEAVDSEVVAPLAAGDDDAVNQAEAPTQAAGDGAEKQAQTASFVVVDDMEWAEIVIAFCLASAIDIALLSVQGH